MKFQTIRYFVALAESRTICEASRRLHVAQPSLSKSLQLMEDELGLQLFVRSTQGIQLTEPGKKVLSDARQILSYYDGWKELGRENTLKQIDIYIHLSFPDFLLPNIVLSLQKKYPDVLINTHISGAPELYISRSASHPVIALVLANTPRDIAAFAKAQGNPPLVLMRGEYRCLVNAGHPLAGRESVTLRDLEDYYLILPDLRDDPKNAAPQDAVLASILEHIPQNRRVSVQTVANVISLIHQDPESYGLSFYPAANRYPLVHERKLVGVPIEEEATRGILALFYSERACEQHPVIHEMVGATQDASREFLARHGGV